MKTWLLAYSIGSPSWIRTMVSNRLGGTITIKCFYVNRRSSKAKNLLETHYSPISHELTIWTFD